MHPNRMHDAVPHWRLTGLGGYRPSCLLVRVVNRKLAVLHAQHSKPGERS